ncbi:hypothetical protein ACULUM_001009 [Acinetobacter baumannii]|uniref:hypothetical protein n=1 Tax=Acinetobacter TaxID=469 RepID=UPI000D692182|nr:MULTISPECIES: hypothetical protein [Acinetobacter calcoaceticus/baumannii complex]MCH2072915.1 hypothetical protein [Acinetobacter pittii]
MKKFKAHIYTDIKDNFSIQTTSNIHLFCGKALDDRGRELLKVFSEKSSTIHSVHFEPNTMQFSIDNKIVEFNNIEYLSEFINAENTIIIDSTTLGLPEIFYLIKQFIALSFLHFKIIYIEPLKYNKDESDDFYKLSHYPIGYKPIPGAVGDLHHDDLDLGVFFVGFDPSRMEIALEEFQMIQGKSIKTIFATPAFNSGLELESIVPHLNLLIDNRNFEIDFCSALDPTSSFELLNYYKKSLDDGQKLFVAPLGTKPTTIASALFANLHSKDVSLLYDHPLHLENRTIGVKEWHIYSIYLTPIQ